MNFMFFENETKVWLKFKKNYFFNLESLFDGIQNERYSENFLGSSIIFSDEFYFMHQIRSFYTISMFITNTKINFCILLFSEFYVFGK